MSDHKPHSTPESVFDNDHYDEQAEPPSKSELKRQSAELQQLGETIVNLTPAQVDMIPMDDDLAEAVHQARAMNRKKEGFRRQIQFIGKLLRQRDVAPIHDAMARITHQHQQANAAFHAVEKARDAILASGDKAIEPLLSKYPELERQRLRQLYRQANKEQQKNGPPKAARELFQYLKQHIHEA